MTMHLLPPMYSTNGKKKGKSKHRTSMHAAKSRANAEAWEKLLEKYDVKPVKKSATKSVHRSPTIPDHRRTVFDGARSVDTGAGIAPKAPIKQYTGENMLGIGQLHKSNAIPVFKQEDAEAISKMRRG